MARIFNHPFELDLVGRLLCFPFRYIPIFFFPYLPLWPYSSLSLHFWTQFDETSIERVWTSLTTYYIYLTCTVQPELVSWPFSGWFFLSNNLSLASIPCHPSPIWDHNSVILPEHQYPTASLIHSVHLAHLLCLVCFWNAVWPNLLTCSTAYRLPSTTALLWQCPPRYNDCCLFPHVWSVFKFTPSSTPAVDSSSSVHSPLNHRLIPVTTIVYLRLLTQA
jgi:hypothetical protein